MSSPTSMELLAAVVNTYGYVGNEFVDFCAVVSENKRGMSRGRSLILLLAVFGVYENIENIILAHETSKKPSQRAEVIAAIDAKDAAVAAARENRRPKVK